MRLKPVMSAKQSAAPSFESDSECRHDLTRAKTISEAIISMFHLTFAHPASHVAQP